MAMLPPGLEDDHDLALLYLYFCIRYLDEQLYKVILSRTNNLEYTYIDIQSLVKDPRSFHKLSDD